jgi:hypothetical protein
MRMRDLGLLSRFHGNQTIVRLFENKFVIITSKSPTEKTTRSKSDLPTPLHKKREISEQRERDF